MTRVAVRYLATIGLAVMTLSMSIDNARAMTVQPVVLDLKTSGHGMSQAITVENNSESPLPVELSVSELVIDSAGTHTGGDPGDLIVFPTQALIRPGQSQAFRIQYVGDPALEKSKHYYVTAAQQPVKFSNPHRGIQILTNFEVLVSVGPQGEKPHLSALSGAIGRNGKNEPVPIVTIGNDSKTYGYLSHGELEIAQMNAEGREVFRKSYSGAEVQQMVGMGLIDPGQRRQFTIPIVLPSAGGTVEVRFESQN